MKDSFILEGKKYISARRASEISEYAPDYIGQLCRAKKLDFQMIGRSWFVTEESLRRHQEEVQVDKANRKRSKIVDGEMDNLNTPTGKNYISTKRASEITGYSADYIGQLCRAKKLDFKIVGRSYFVTEESIRNHQQGVQGEEANRNRINNLKGSRNGLNDGTDTEIPATKAEVNPNKVEVLALLAAPTASNMVESIMNDIESAVENSSSFTRPVPIQSIGKSMVDTIAQTVLDRQNEVVAYPTDRNFIQSAVTRRLARRILNSSIAVCLIIGLFLGGDYLLNPPITDSNGQTVGYTANIFDAARSAVNYIGGGFNSLLALFGHGKEVAMNQSSQTNAAVSGSEANNPGGSALPPTGNGDESNSQGVAILPSSGSQNSDDAAKKKIQSTFSDQVEVHPDVSGTTGVITPVFKQSTGKGFIYVMVPIKKGNSP